MEEIYDLVILGAGPAGICAAIYATRGKLNTLWLEKKFLQGGQIVDTYEVDNYPGLPGITGKDHTLRSVMIFLCADHLDLTLIFYRENRKGRKLKNPQCQNR